MSKDVKFNIHLSVDGKDMVVNAKSSVKELSAAVGAIRGEAKKSTETLLRFNQSVQAVRNVYGGFQQLAGAMQPFIAKANAAAEAQTKLTTVMRQRMGATQADMAAINQLVAAQTKLGVVGGTVQRSGLAAAGHVREPTQHADDAAACDEQLVGATEGAECHE